MTKNDIPPVKLIPITALIASMLYSSHVLPASVKKTNLNDTRWLSDGDDISVVIDRNNDRLETQLVFVLDKNDVTSLFKQREPNVYIYSPSVMLLPKGVTSLKVYEVQENGAWKKIGEYPVQVKTTFGFKESDITTAVDVSIKSEIDNNYKGDAVAPPLDQQKQTSMTTNISYRATASSDDFNLKTNFNLIGVSKPEEALRFGEKSYDAEKLDLSDYLIELNSGKQSLSLGNVSFGDNRYLISGFGSRGLSYKNKYGGNDVFDFSLTRMNGTSIVGFSNITGLEGPPKHYITAASVGYEFISARPGGLRAELTYLDASILAIDNFDTGEITDAETSSGYGLKLIGSNESGSFRGEATFASSKYSNPTDPFLFLDDAIVPVEAQTDSARYAEFSYEMYRSKPDESGASYSVSVTASHERVDPLYKSLAAFASADTQTNTANLAIQLGAASILISNIESEDNIENLETVLKTKTDTSGIGVGIPFRQMYSDKGKENALIPNFDIQYNKVHQYGANRPTTFDPDTHIPDQVTVNENYSLNWGAEKLTVSYTLSISDQDNRQIGRANADFKNINRIINFGYQFSSNFNVSIGAGKVKAFDYENDLVVYDDTYSFGFNWNINDKLRLTTSYNEAQTKDSQVNSTSNNYFGNAQLSWQFEMPSLTGKKMPGQFFIGYSMQNNRNRNNVFISETNAQSWTINAGLNISLF